MTQHLARLATIAGLLTAMVVLAGCDTTGTRSSSGSSGGAGMSRSNGY